MVEKTSVDINREILFSYNMTLEEYNRLSLEVKKMLLLDYWSQVNKEKHSKKLIKKK